MSEFNQRWQLGAEHARNAPTDKPVDIPTGFATRVVARAANRRAAEPALETLWELFIVRATICAAAVLLGCIVLDRYGLPDEATFLPEIEPLAVSLPWTS